MSHATAHATAHDIALERDRMRRRRIYRAAIVVLAVEAWFIVLPLTGRSPIPRLPAVDPIVAVVVVFFVLMIAVLLGTQVVASRSPHLTYRPEQVDVTLDDVIGIDPVKEDVLRSIELFQIHKRFADRTGQPAARPAVRGPARDRKDHDREGDGRRGGCAVPLRLSDVVPVDVLRRHGAQDPRLLRGVA